MGAMKWFKAFLLVFLGFWVGIMAVIGGIVFAMSLPSRFLPPPAPPAERYAPPPLKPGQSLPGRAEAHLYNLSVSPGGLSARVDATVAEALLDSLARQAVEQWQKESRTQVRVSSTRLAFTDKGLYVTMGLEGWDFQAGQAQPLKGDVAVVVEGVEVLGRGYRAQVELSFGEDLANSFLAWQLPRFQEQGQLPLKARAAQVSFREDKLRAVVTLELLMLPVDVGVQARLGVRDGRLHMAVENIDLGRLPLPDVLVKQVNSYIDQGIARVEQQQLPLRIQDIRLEQGRMIIKALVESK